MLSRDATQNMRHVLFTVLLSLLIFVAVVTHVIYFQPNYVINYVDKWYSSVFWYAQTIEKVCSLTIDDAPSSMTAEILNVLKKYNITATFFIMSNRVEKYQAVIRRMVQEGHTLGNHLTQDEPSIDLSDQEFEQKLLQCDAVLSLYQNQTKGHTKWMRPGSGFFSRSMLKMCEKHHYNVCLGNTYAHDAQIKSVSVNTWYYQHRTRPGSILIMHDRAWTIPTLKAILPTLSESFDFVSLEKLQSYDDRDSTVHWHEALILILLLCVTYFLVHKVYNSYKFRIIRPTKLAMLKLWISNELPTFGTKNK